MKALSSWNLPGPEGWSFECLGDTAHDSQESGAPSPAHPWCSECTERVGNNKKRSQENQPHTMNNRAAKTGQKCRDNLSKEYRNIKHSESKGGTDDDSIVLRFI